MVLMQPKAGTEHKWATNIENMAMHNNKQKPKKTSCHTLATESVLPVLPVLSVLW